MPPGVLAARAKRSSRGTAKKTVGLPSVFPFLRKQTGISPLSFRKSQIIFVEIHQICEQFNNLFIFILHCFLFCGNITMLHLYAILNSEVKNMKKANGILVTKGKDDYSYIDKFIDFLWRIVKIIIVLFDRISGKATDTDAEMSELDDANV